MTRSNRTLTQFAADKLAEFVNNQWTGPVTQSKGNTTVKVFTPKDKLYILKNVLRKIT